MKKIVVLQSHPIQYHSPFYDLLSQQPNLKTIVYYCSNYGADGNSFRMHPEVGKVPNWDISLIDGHEHIFLENNAPKPSIFNGFWGVINWRIFSQLRKDKPDYVLILGWNYFSLVYGALVCKLLGIKTVVRGDNTLQRDDKLIKGYKVILKKLLYGYMLFPLYTKVGYAGESNRLFFKKYKVNDNQLVWLPHAVDNQRFYRSYLQNVPNKRTIRSGLGINSTDFVLLFVGRLIEDKKPADLLLSFKALKNAHLLIVGEGPYRADLEQIVEAHNIQNCHFLGFKNQTELTQYFSVADIFTLPSYMDTWGLVINEAMNFKLPILTTSFTGSAANLVTPENGCTVAVGDVAAMTAFLKKLASNPDLRESMGEKSYEIVQEYSYERLAQNLLALMA